MVEKCYGCLAEFPAEEGVCHPYIGAIWPCWKRASENSARELSDPAYGIVNPITVNVYGAQHIGDQSDRRARQSGMAHLVSLSAIYQRNLPFEEAFVFLRKATNTKREWPALVQRVNPGWLTILDVLKAQNAREHEQLVIQWGQSVWDAYADVHQQVREIYDQVLKSS